jgi:hypothetical protein
MEFTVAKRYILNIFITDLVTVFIANQGDLTSLFGFFDKKVASFY